MSNAERAPDFSSLDKKISSVRSDGCLHLQMHGGVAQIFDGCNVSCRTSGVQVAHKHCGQIALVE